jgi:NitT/TauT family transport system substrate-binding protein
MKIFKTLLLTFLVITVSCKEGDIKEQKPIKEKVTIAMVTFPGYAPLYLAKEKNLFEGIDVELVRIEDIGQMRSAMQSGKIDIYAATYDIFQATKGIEPSGIGFLAMDESHGGDGIVVTSDINKIEDFKGKNVAAEPGFPPYFILQYLLDNEGLTIKDVNFNDLASQDAGNAFVARQFDIVGTYEPYLSISAEKRDGAKILYSSKDTSGLIVDWLFANPTLVKDKPEVLLAISKGWFKALQIINSNPDEAYAIMGDAYGMPAEEMKGFKTGITWLNLGDNLEMHNELNPNNASSTFKRVGDILEKNNETDVRLKPENHLTSEIIEDLK